MTARVAFAAIAVLWLLPGCLEGEPPPTVDIENVSAHGMPSERDLQDLVFEDCDGLTSELVVQTDLVQSRHDPAWAKSEEGLAVIQLFGLDCSRVAWMGFEGPAQILFESARGDAVIPLGCYPDSDDWLGASVASIWVAEPMLAAALADAYDGLPIYKATIDISQSWTGATYRWTWGAGESVSSLVVQLDPLPQEGPFDRMTRFFWFNETAISALDVRHEKANPPNAPTLGTGNRIGYGEMAPPMLASSLPGYVAPAEKNESVSGTGEVIRFSDHFCSEEVP